MSAAPLHSFKFTIVAFTFACLYALWHYATIPDTSNGPNASARTAQDGLSQTTTQASPAVPSPDMLGSRLQPGNTQAVVDGLIARLKGEFAERINDVAFQVSLKGMRDDLRRRFPEQGEALFEEIIRAAFPNLADQILANVALMDRYDDWLLDNMRALNDMDLLTQQGTLWAKRRELFGANAELIWSDELSAKAEREAAVQRTVQNLDTAYDTTMNERIFVLKSAFEENMSNLPTEAVLDTRGLMAQVFFGFDSVQKELKQLEPEARQQEIAEIRRQMGFDETRIAELAERDAQREKRWQNGYAYMEARKTLVDNLQGEELEDGLRAVRQKYFGDEALTIQREEEDLGFFRYARPRLYGRN